MAGFEALRAELAALGASVVAASTDPVDKAREAAQSLSFPVCWGVTREQADAIGAWWEERRAIVQPSEFLLDAQGRVVTSTYSAGPIGRVDAADVVKLIRFRDAQQAAK